MRDEIRRRAARIGWPILVTVLMLVGWELAVRVLGIRSIILPPPSEVLAVMVERHDLLLAHLWPSLYLTVLGFALSVIGGVLAAVLITY
jgi:NitT/TauT family transport system permease protein